MAELKIFFAGRRVAELEIYVFLCQVSIYLRQFLFSFSHNAAWVTFTVPQSRQLESWRYQLKAELFPQSGFNESNNLFHLSEFPHEPLNPSLRT